MRVVLFLCLICSCLNLFAQDDKDDLLNTNANPVFNLMGIAPTDFRRPTSLKDVTATIQTATNDFSMLPASYAVELSPVHLFDLEDKNILKDDLGLTIGYNNEVMDLETGMPALQVGIGLNFGYSHKTIAADKRVTKAESRALLAEVETILQKMEVTLKSKDENLSQTQELEEANKKIENLKKGDVPAELFVDFSCGYVHEFPRGEMNEESSIRNIGSWITGGYENIDSTVSILGQIKWTHDPNIAEELKIDDLGKSALDLGARIILNSKNQLFDISFEFIHRFRDKLPESMSRNKYLFNINVTAPNDVKLNLTLGKDFDENITREGNLLSLVNLVKSF